MHLVLMPLAIFGALGVPVLMELAEWLRGRVSQLSNFSRTAIGFYLGMYVVLLLVFMALQWQASAPDPAWRSIVARSSIAAINSRTAGFAFSYVAAFPRAMQWVLIVAMFVGGNPASTAGGLKTTALAELFRGTGRVLRG